MYRRRTSHSGTGSSEKTPSLLNILYLKNMESQLAGKAPIHIGSKSISKISENNKTQDQMTSHLSDTSSGSDISDDDFSKRYSLSTKAPTSNSSAFLTNTPTAHTHNKPLNSYSSFIFIYIYLEPFTAAPIKPPVSSLSSLPSNKINSIFSFLIQDPKMTSSIPPPLQTSFLTKLGIADSSSSPNTSSKNFASEKLQLEASREEERKIRAANVGTIDMNAQSDMMKIFEEKL
ncbi:hypothetical protein HZS_3908 [Henneguya salminicola]|nr:hypothetical protein HZS_3908 [Henneguya salminicola]